MAKGFTKDDLLNQKHNALQKLDTLLSDFIESSDSHLNKKASLLSYWINSYIKYIHDENCFDSTKLKSYKRGDIIKLNFGFNVGSEYGGLHYAIVINNHNPRNSSVLTVIPLTSHKEGEEIHPNDVFLGNEIYRNLKIKYDTISQNLQREKEEIDKTLLLVDTLFDLMKDKLNDYDTDPVTNKAALNEAKQYLTSVAELKQDLNRRNKQNNDASAQLNKIGAEIKRMKIGSIALVEQITTVSKMRIYDPRNAHGVLSGIRLSPESLDKVNNKIKELFVF